jgi:hypothetical protein
MLTREDYSLAEARAHVKLKLISETGGANDPSSPGGNA